jgi:ssDNA-binding Zn-finger/Zn-ribbon topoisomerase 1
METLIVIGIIVVIIWYQINKCPHGIYNGNNCKVCAEEKERRRLQEEEQQRRKEKMIHQAEEKRQEEAKKLKEEIEHQKMLWLEETRKLEFLLQLDPQRFQELMWLLFRKLGWEVKETPFSQDGGSDGLLIRGATSMILQCKRYRKDIGEPTIRDLYGTYTHLKANGAILVTTGRISDPAKKFAQDKNIEMYDGETLLSCIAQANLTASLIPDRFVVKHGKLLPLYKEKLRELEGEKKKIENEIEKENCPQCGIGKLQVRQGYRGLFMGCSRDPKCDYTTNLIKPKKSSKGYYARPRNP